MGPKHQLEPPNIIAKKKKKKDFSVCYSLNNILLDLSSTILFRFSAS